jgi:hypothetical protein
MKVQIVILITFAITSSYVVSGKKSPSVSMTNGAPTGPSSSGNGYSQPIPQQSYPAPTVQTAAGRQDVYGGYNSQPMMMAASSPTADYYQPIDSAGYGSYPAPSPSYGSVRAPPAAGPYYEPVPQGSGHHPHHHHHAMKRGHGWHPHNELQNILYVALPLIILPLLLLWPWFIYASSHHHHPVVYAAGWKRSTDGKAPVVSTAEEAKNKKTDELTEQILPKLEKKDD